LQSATEALQPTIIVVQPSAKALKLRNISLKLPVSRLEIFAIKAEIVGVLMKTPEIRSVSGVSVPGAVAQTKAPSSRRTPN